MMTISLSSTHLCVTLYDSAELGPGIPARLLCTTGFVCLHECDQTFARFHEATVALPDSVQLELQVEASLKARIRRCEFRREHICMEPSAFAKKDSMHVSDFTCHLTEILIGMGMSSHDPCVARSVLA